MNWLEIAHSCNSSYKENGLGWTLYGLVRTLRPRTAVEIGVLEGYSAIFIAAALRDNIGGDGRLYAYDLWEKYPHRHVTQDQPYKKLEDAGLISWVSLNEADAAIVPHLFERGQCQIDFLHIDISNDGDTYWWAMNAFHKILVPNGIMVLEGGTSERDQCEWMVKYNKVPIRAVLDDESMMAGWEAVTIPPYPGLTIMRRRG